MPIKSDLPIFIDLSIDKSIPIFIDWLLRVKYIVLTFCWHSIEALAAFAF